MRVKKREFSAHKKKRQEESRLTEDFEMPESTDSKKMSPREIANELQSVFVPENKNLQDCIIEQLDLWNTIIDPRVRKENTDNVNAFIRDRVKAAHKTQSFSKLSADRIRDLAGTLIKAPGLEKVKNKTALRLYIEYYILWLILHSV